MADKDDWAEVDDLCASWQQDPAVDGFVAKWKAKNPDLGREWIKIPTN